MKLFFEKIYPYLFGTLAGYIWLECAPGFPCSDAIISSTLTVAGMFVGFLATSKAILISMNSSLINSLKKSGYMNELVSYVAQAIWLSLGFCALDVVGYFVDRQANWFGIIWVALSVALLMAFIRVTDIMLKIFKYS